MTPELALRDALFGLLKAHPIVAGFVGERIFDEVPSDEQGRTQRGLDAYIYLGPMSRQRIRQDCAQIWTMRARLYAISDAWGRSQAWDIVEAMVQAVDDKGEGDFALPEPFVISEDLHVLQAGDVVDPLAPKAVYVDLTTTIIRAP